MEAQPSPSPPRRGKPPELEDWLNSRIYHPLSGRIAAALAPTPVTPNMVSVAGGTMIVAAGIVYVGIAGWAGVALGFLLHALWHVLDGADGDLARRTGRASPWGELIDGACDYIGHFLLYVIVGVTLAQSVGWWAYPLGLSAGLSRIAQANHSESGRRTYLWRVYGVPWLKQARPDPGSATAEKGLAARLMAAVGRVYVAAAADPLAGRVDELMDGGRAGEAARSLCKRASRAPLRLQSLLGPNWRTVAMALSMATGSALWFFLLEVLAGNALLLWSKHLQKRCDRELAERLGD
ncbi:MAG TPA: CDP-alcohol phosphatidyltransferase family protein [Allosphingosinicella sp.]|jgi:hypothetical protein